MLNPGFFDTNTINLFGISKNWLSLGLLSSRNSLIGDRIVSHTFKLIFLMRLHIRIRRGLSIVMRNICKEIDDLNFGIRNIIIQS